MYPVEKQYLCTMTYVLSLTDVAKMLRLRPEDAHKGTMGHACLVAGSMGVAGCAMLASEACLRSGVGKLTVCTPECNRLLLQMAVPEAVLMNPSVGGVLFAGFERGKSLPWQSVGVGPGIGLDAGDILESILVRSSGLPLVVDADALRILASRPCLAEYMHGHAVLTPHAGEMKALAEGLLKQSPEVSDYHRLLELAVLLAKQQEWWVVLKGHPTHICLPDGSVWLCNRGNAGMATAGSGDVLTGLLTGLLAQGYPLSSAVSLGVWIHSSAGDCAASSLGQESMLARDIIAAFPAAWRELHESHDMENKGS